MIDETAKPVFLQKHNISEDIVVYIKQQIISGELNPGDRIVETKLARELRISQTPIREALRQLQGENVVTIVANKGPYVRMMEPNDVYEIYSIRSMLEGLAIRLAVLRATDDDLAAIDTFYDGMKRKLDDDTVAFLLEDSFWIHKKIIELSGHSRLRTMYRSISFQVMLINRLLGTKQTKQREVDQHEELIEALKRRDPDHAERTMRRHIYRSYCEFIEMNGLPRGMQEHEEQTWL